MTNEAGALRTAALAAAARGWRVFPLRPGDKRPAFPDHDTDHCTRRDPRCRGGHAGWEQRATIDPQRIHRGWTATTAFNVGIATGPSRLLVVDLDTPKPGQTPPPEWAGIGVTCGADVLAVLADRAGQPVPEDTFTVTTGRGGQHLYFTPPAGSRLGNTSGKNGRGLGWLIDTRGHGGYVVAAGSTVAGRPYTVTRERPIAPLPPWLFQRLSPPPRPPQPTPVAVAVRSQSAYLNTAVDRELDLVVNAAPGTHNATLYSAALVLGQLAAGGAFSSSHAAYLLEQAADGHIAGPCDCRPTGIRATIASGLRAGAKRPRTVRG